MADTMIPAGMTEKEYFEIHASQEGVFRLVPTSRNSLNTKTKCDGGYGSLLLCRRKDQALNNSSQGSPLSKLFGSGWRFMDKGEDAAHACQREVREEVNLDLPLEKN